MNAPVTRRALLGATAAFGAVSMPALAEAVIPVSDLDAHLFNLIAQHAAAEAEIHRAGSPSIERPRHSTPLLLHHRMHCAGERTTSRARRRAWACPRRSRMSRGERREYQARGVGWLRNQPAATWFVTLVPPIGPECELRRLEILAAWDSYMADRQVVAISTGYAAASEASDTAAALVCDLAAEIARVRPRTSPGLRALAVWFEERVEADGVHDDLLDLFARTVSVFGVAA